MGKMSRDKGRRTEYLIRDYLRALGIYDDVFRVPLSGSSEGFKSDVVARKGNVVDTFEVKARATDFNKIYDVYNNNRDERRALRFAAGSGPSSPLIALSVDFLEAKRLDVPFFGVERDPGNDRTYSKIVRMSSLLQGADYLVIKGNSKPPIFIKYWSK